MPLSEFHPAVARWFARHFSAPTRAQRDAWPAIARGAHTLLAAPTGSGKTLAAFLCAIDALVRESRAGPLPDETRVLYVSPLKALSNDIDKNLQQPLAGVEDALLEGGQPPAAISTFVRTGDTPASARERARRKPPHIVVTTPESLYLLLTSDSGRKMLRTVRTVIVDEIHALAGEKRGAHLALSLERLQALAEQPLQRIGLSATQRPLSRMADFLIGARDQRCRIIDAGHLRERDLALEVPGAPLEAVMANEVWGEIYDRLADLCRAHQTTLIFVNTRRLAERAARHLAERLGEDAVTAHHGSLSREHRLDAEQRLKAGELQALVATASLELGIDIGDIDLVCQLGSPRAIAAFLQRVGRAGHAVGATPRGRLFPLSRDDLCECAALLDAVARDELDEIAVPPGALDVLAQQIVAEVAAAGEWGETELLTCFRRAAPYKKLSDAQFESVLAMLADGFTTRRGRRSAHLHRDRVNHRLRPRRAARLVALTNGGVIPDQFDYDVVLAPEGFSVGTLNEDFAFESLPGDIFQLGNTSYRILKVETGRVLVEDAKGQPPNIPFWFGEAPGRTDELSLAVSRLRQRVEVLLGEGRDGAISGLTADLPGLPLAAACQLIDYLAAACAALGGLPNQRRIVLERFFDESGDMHLVVHSSFGSRLNRAWGLALRKRFCRKFNFELQAAALEDCIVLSLGATHSFQLAEVKNYLHPNTVRDVLTQALLDVPMFATHWRWNATTALAIQRNRNGKKIPPQWQRNDAEDLIALVFPDQLACLENIAGARQIPDHPLVEQTLRDCLCGLMDIDGLEVLLGKIGSGEVAFDGRDLASPSPLASEILNARPYAFLDDAPAEERRTLAVQQRRFMTPDEAATLGQLDAAAIAKVRDEAWPLARDADELHDALCLLGFVTAAEGQPAQAYFGQLQAERRAAVVAPPNVEAGGGAPLWIAAERLAELRAVLADCATDPPIDAVSTAAAERGAALVELIRSRLEGLGPVTAQQLGAPLGLPADEIQPALLALEQEGFALRGEYEIGAGEQWCERGLLARIHRYTLNRLRREIEPVSAADFMRFLFQWQGLGAHRGEGRESLAAVLDQLAGLALPAAAWEAHILPARLRLYTPDQLDSLCQSGRIVWLRPGSTGGREAAPRKSGTLAATGVALVARGDLELWRLALGRGAQDQLSGTARRLLDALDQKGAAFFADLVRHSGLLRTQVETALGELVSAGLVTADGFAGLRALCLPASQRSRRGRGRRRSADYSGLDSAGRWDRLPAPAEDADQAAIELFADALLRRYGVVFRRLLEREPHAPPWRALLTIYRRMEARGELRGGRFVDGMAGEQFALAEALGALRELRRRPGDGEYVAISAADPLNLSALISPGERVPAQAKLRLLYRDGVPVARLDGRDIGWLAELGSDERFAASQALLRAAGHATGHAGPASERH